MATCGTVIEGNVEIDGAVRAGEVIEDYDVVQAVVRAITLRDYALVGGAVDRGLAEVGEQVAEEGSLELARPPEAEDVLGIAEEKTAERDHAAGAQLVDDDGWRAVLVSRDDLAIRAGRKLDTELVMFEVLKILAGAGIGKSLAGEFLEERLILADCDGALARAGRAQRGDFAAGDLLDGP